MIHIASHLMLPDLGPQDNARRMHAGSWQQ
jgi:hypothetical protein